MATDFLLQSTIKLKALKFITETDICYFSSSNAVISWYAFEDCLHIIVTMTATGTRQVSLIPQDTTTDIQIHTKDVLVQNPKIKLFFSFYFISFYIELKNKNPGFLSIHLLFLGFLFVQKSGNFAVLRWLQSSMLRLKNGTAWSIVFISLLTTVWR